MTGSQALIQPDCQDDAGFTLLELLVALALFSLLATMLLGNVRFGLDAWRHGTAHADRVERSIIAQNLLRRMIGDAYPLFLGYGAGHPRIDFDGTNDHVNFLGNAPIVVGGGGRFRFNLFVERQRGQSDLVLTSMPELAGAQSQLMSNKTLLLTDVDRVNFSYFGVEMPDQTARWHDRWTQRNEMPKLVRVRVAFRSDGASLWPDLLIVPHVSADVSCVYDPITTRCRGR